MFFHNVPNIELRYYQVQADIVVDMLTFGWFGANVREALMLGKPVVCYIRPEFAEQVREELPEYIDELPVVSATPETVESVLKELVQDPHRRRELGRRSREFALKWHSAEAGARRMDQIYSSLLEPGRLSAGAL
jgi:glycosyltransferase involved in cell wall biosynthesis